MVKSYKDLLVWQKGRELVKQVYDLTDDFPTKERFRLTDQLCRAAISVPSNIAEGSSRKTTQEYIRFLNIAFGSLAEMETQLMLATDLGYLSAEKLSPASQRIEELARMLNALIESLAVKKREDTELQNVTKLQTLNSRL